MKCYICRGPLSGKQKKFCSQSCQKFHKQNEDKKRHLNARPLRPKRKCIFCNKLFRPRGDIHKCCDSVCRNLLETKKKRENTQRNRIARKKRPEKQIHIWKGTPTINPPAKEEPSKIAPRIKKIAKDRGKKFVKPNPLPIFNSQYREDIQEYLKNGGSIQLHPAQLDGRTPEVNITSLGGWSIDAILGFGYEIELMDELSSISEVGDAN